MLGDQYLCESDSVLQQILKHFSVIWEELGLSRNADFLCTQIQGTTAAEAGCQRDIRWGSPQTDNQSVSDGGAEVAAKAN